MIDGLVDSYWTHWWTKQSDTEFTFYEEWSFELQGGKYWTKGSELQWYWCDFLAAHEMEMDKVPCHLYSAKVFKDSATVYWMAFENTEDAINTIDDAFKNGVSPFAHLSPSGSTPSS